MFCDFSVTVNCPSCKHEFSFLMPGACSSHAFPPGSCIVCPSCGHTFSMTNAEIGAGYYENQFYHAALLAVLIIAALSLLLVYAL